MSERALIGVAAFTRTKSSMPRLVAMLPHVEEAEEGHEGEGEGAAAVVFGMDLVTIPYANEVRAVEAMDLGGVAGEALTAEEKDAAMEVVKAMQFSDGFQYQDLQSPAIQYMYSVLQAFALNEVDIYPSYFPPHYVIITTHKYLLCVSPGIGMARRK